MTPQSSSAYQLAAIESKEEKTTTDFKFQVESLLFYCHTVQGPRIDSENFFLDLNQTKCQTAEITSDDFSQKTFDVSPGSYALTVAYQDGRVLSNTKFPPLNSKSTEMLNGI